jgi:hypothetical protein
MLQGEVNEIVRRAEQLLWVLARCDVEDLSSTRAAALKGLNELECAARIHGADLYHEVLENAVLNQ